MTPQLQQAIKLLALSNLELEAYLAEALEGNPLLDTVSPDSEGDAPGEDAPEPGGEAPDPDLALASDAGRDPDGDFAEDRLHPDSPSDLAGLPGICQDPVRARGVQSGHD